MAFIASIGSTLAGEVLNLQPRFIKNFFQPIILKRTFNACKKEKTIQERN